MTQKEQDVRENLAILNNIGKKLDIVRNELLPLYGNVTLKEVEELLWNQYLKINQRVHLVFEDNKS
jgi:hypothetical protein